LEVDVRENVLQSGAEGTELWKRGVQFTLYVTSATAWHFH